MQGVDTYVHKMNKINSSDGTNVAYSGIKVLSVQIQSNMS